MKARVLPLIAAISAASLSMQTLAYGPIDGKVYGKINVWVESQDLDKASSKEPKDPKGGTTNVVSDASRLGYKGESKLDGATPLKDAKVTYQIEYEVSVDDGDNKGQTFTARNTYVGLKGSYGEVRVGMQDTHFKEAQGKVDQFNDLRGDFKALFNGENRLKNTIYYSSPEISGISGGLTYSTREAKTDSTDAKPNYQQEAVSLAVKLTQGDLYAALAYDTNVTDVNAKDTKAKKEPTKGMRAVVTYKLDPVTLGAMWQQEDKKAGDNEDGYLLSAAYTFSDNLTLKAQYTDSSIKNEGQDQKSIGADYKLAKPTKLFAFYTEEDADAKDSGKSWLGIGIEHNF